ncbi:MAG TPA: hypothetical protein VFV94_16900 [Polyangiaceae bacterium]|nr:hypothetical protein [Polyangiaceae bacterium]
MPAVFGSTDPARTAPAPWLFLSALSLALSGCGGATPLLHPAHTLAPGKVMFSGGVSGTFIAGDAKQSLEEARAITSSGGVESDEDRKALTEGTLVSVLAAPGLAPWVGGRVGVAERTEAGIGYTGRWARLDVRHALEDRKFALSLGVAGLVMLSHPSADPAEPSGTSSAVSGVDSNGAYGFGVSVPVIVGYRSDAELVQAWGGVVAGFEQAMGDVVLAKPWEVTPSDEVPDILETKLDAHRFSGAVLVGLAVGIQPIWVAVEISGRYFSIDGTMRGGSTVAKGDFTGVSIEPAGAILGRF